MGLARGVVGLGLCAACSAIPAAQRTSSEAADPRPKALMIFVDGFIPAGIRAERTPHLWELLSRGAYSLEAQAESTTISGSGWSTFLTGVHYDKHGVPDNEFSAPRYALFPHVAQLLKRARPASVTASAQCWRPIEALVETGAVDLRSFHDYDETSQDYFDELSCDSLCVRDMTRFLVTPELDLAVIMFGELDGVGHSEENAHYSADDPLYGAMLAKLDGHIGALLGAIRARPSYDDENWLVLVSADHGGEQHRGHGANTPAQRTIPLIVSGPRALRGSVAGPLWPAPQAVDVVPTVLHHLGVTARAEWQLDGVPVGFAPSARPAPRIGVNLVFNGDGEFRRGFQGASGQPDAALAGWNDPGYATLIAYGAPGGYPDSRASAAASAGANFFAGGALNEDSFMEQTIDLTTLAADVDQGLHYEFQAWLGGFANQADRASARARFLDARGSLLAQSDLAAVSAEERAQQTGFLLRQATGKLPPRTRKIEVRITFHAGEGSNDGYADGITLTLKRAR